MIPCLTKTKTNTKLTQRSKIYENKKQLKKYQLVFSSHTAKFYLIKRKCESMTSRVLQWKYFLTKTDTRILQRLGPRWLQAFRLSVFRNERIPPHPPPTPPPSLPTLLSHFNEVFDSSPSSWFNAFTDLPVVRARGSGPATHLKTR